MEEGGAEAWLRKARLLSLLFIDLTGLTVGTSFPSPTMGDHTSGKPQSLLAYSQSFCHGHSGQLWPSA